MYHSYIHYIHYYLECKENALDVCYNLKQYNTLLEYVSDFHLVSLLLMPNSYDLPYL